MFEIVGEREGRWILQRCSFDLDTAGVAVATRQGSSFQSLATGRAGPVPLPLPFSSVDTLEGIIRIEKEGEREGAFRVTRALRPPKTPAPTVITLITESLGFFINTALLLLFYFPFSLFLPRWFSFFRLSATSVPHDIADRIRASRALWKIQWAPFLVSLAVNKIFFAFTVYHLATSTCTLVRDARYELLRSAVWQCFQFCCQN